MPGSRKTLRRYQSYRGKSQLPSDKGAMTEFTGRWQNLRAGRGCKEADNYILLVTHRHHFPSDQALHTSAAKVFAQGPATERAGLRRNSGQNFHANPSV